MDEHKHNKADEPNNRVDVSQDHRIGFRPGQASGSSPSRFLWPLLVGVIVFCALYLIPLPLYTYKPGTAEPVGPMVRMEQNSETSGSFLLTTIGLSDTNLVGFIYAKLNSDLYELRPKNQVHRDGESESEYNQRQVYNMRASQSNAIQAAYELAGVSYEVVNTGVLVLRVSEDMPAYGKLRAGDTILSIDGQSASHSTEMLDYLSSKQPGDRVVVEIERSGGHQQMEIELAELPPQPGEASSRAGLGVSIANKQEIQPEDEKFAVSVEAGQIGGPSAGLMFALEIYNRLVGEDITKGYTIAGTGEIDPEGNVGVIGGIQFKVVAADREGADIFFAPNDLYPEADDHFQPILNATIAEEQVRNIKSDMVVVPVGTIEEALEYLQSLPPKESDS
ncbi:SepM family pheromone-processing serine protease [Paenibacillus senegalensis]|uniref:SepM family pheromone-processing serine protease n=1 Tax=Paenibacillus senegalensis TaxID=1465766 RepID=UPI0002896F2D|nr:SepM family pheromone-processing serine protease [Paenibacillus senegalensis]